jgi:DNA-binding beta-propeller fold protein YncE
MPYVASWDETYVVTTIVGTTNTTTRIAVGQYPSTMVVNPATNTIYVVNTKDSSVTVIRGTH